MHARRKRKNRFGSGSGDGAFELNVMPFVDIFSLLCTFLLFSAVFVNIGVHEVQVPFLSSAAPEKPPESKRELTIKVDVSKESVELVTSFTKAPVDEETSKFPRTPSGLAELHTKLVRLRTENKDTDKITLFVDDQIKYDDLVAVLDELRLRKKGDPGFKNTDKGDDADALFPKIVMGSVIL